MTFGRALRDLAALPRDLKQNPLAALWDPKIELRKLDHAVVEIKEKAASLRAPDPGRIKDLVRRYQAAGNKLSVFSLREIRTMSWDSELLASAAFRSQLAEYVRNGEIRPSLLVLSKVYFSNWGKHVQPEIFEQILRILANAQSGYTPLMQRYKRDSSSIFSGDAHAFLGGHVHSSTEKSVPNVLAEWEVPATTPLASAVSDNFVNRTLADFCGGKTYVLEAMIPTLCLPATTAKTLQRAVEQLILSEHTDRSEIVRKKIEAFVLDDDRVGDPRLQHNMPKWVGVDPAAQRKFKTWRATKDLVFFFNNVLREENDPHGRKDFWLRYVERVEDSVVALCPTDFQRLRLVLSNEQVHHCRITDNLQVSCFIMRFRGAKEDLVVTEFSNAGKVRFISYDAFVKNVGSMNKSEFRLKELRTDDGAIASYVHTRNVDWHTRSRHWERNAANTLASFGIRPR
jgi:hypothetical protein